MLQGICTSITPSALSVTLLLPASISGAGAASLMAMLFMAAMRTGIGGWKPLVKFRLTSL